MRYNYVIDDNALLHFNFGTEPCVQLEHVFLVQGPLAEGQEKAEFTEM